MKWFFIGWALAALPWPSALTNMEKSSTNIKKKAQSLERIANEQVKLGQLNRMVELMAANKALKKEIADAKLALDELERASQK